MKAQRSRLIPIGSAVLVGITALGFAVTAFTSRVSRSPADTVSNDLRSAGGNRNDQPGNAGENGGLVDTSTAHSDKTSSRVETEVVTVRLDGFDPKQITRPSGKFLLAVDNRSGLDVILLTLRVEQGVLLHQVTVPKETLDWAQGLDLSPGRYLLREENNPDWVCTLTIIP